MKLGRYILAFMLLLLTLPLMAREEKIVEWDLLDGDSLVPVWGCSVPLGFDAQGEWVARIEYPELVPVHGDEVWLSAVSDSLVGEWPEIRTHRSISARVGSLDISFIPLLWRDGALMKVLSFDLVVEPFQTAHTESLLSSAGILRGSAADWTSDSSADPLRGPAARNASHSVLASGRWVKISVPEDGLYRLTQKKLAQMGFSDPSHVRVYGYGGHLLPETDLHLLPDDLPEVAVCHDGNDVVFYGNGTIRWDKPDDGTLRHVQNHYATAGCYFVTDNDSLPAAAGATATDLRSLLPDMSGMATALYEKEQYAFHPSGRQLFDSYDYAGGAEKSYSFNLTGIKEGTTASVTVSFAHHCDVATTLKVAANGEALGTITIPASAAYSDGNMAEATFKTKSLTASSRIILTHNRAAGTPGHLDFIRICYPADSEARIAAALADVKEPTVVGPVANQDLHATPSTDFVIVVPASGALTAQAERLAQAHRTHDGISVAVIPFDKICNEFSSGTPDATAIRRFMKMLYDRAAKPEEMPRWLLLFGDGAYDNRMVTDNWIRCSADDYLPCFESENSFSATRSFVMEDYFGLLDDGEGSDLLHDKPDVGVGRFPVTTASEARDMVDKAIAYMNNMAAGAWKNTIIMMGDDGDNNQHMEDAEYVAKMIEGNYPRYMLKRIYWDTFPMEITATGNSYPTVHKRILELLDEGALMVNYSGHGSADVLSHELVVDKADMEALSSPRLPLWVTASCDISPFDHTATSFGEYAFLNPRGGAIALFTTTRTVFSSYNRRINYLFTKHVFSRDENGQRLRLGDAVRMAKNDIVDTPNTALQDYTENKLHYVLLGDPALRIGGTDYDAVVDRIDGHALDEDEEVLLSAGQTVTVKGHVADLGGKTAKTFNGTIHPTILDNHETVVGRNNNGSATEPFSFVERSKVLFTGSDSVRAGEFAFSFRVPMDINYSGESGLINLYAIDNTKTAEAQGRTSAFLLGGTAEGLTNDETGPQITLSLNTPSFVSGDKVNETPLLLATLEDPDGINTVGNGIGHDIVAVVDGSAALTWRLNNYYTSAFGDYTRGTLAYSLPALTPGHHTLLLRAWDMMNNSNTATVEFEVVEGLAPVLTDITFTHNPATTGTTFIVTHDRPETLVTFHISVCDLSGRVLWTSDESVATSDTTYTRDWDLCTSSGTPLGTGVYLCQVVVSSASGNSASGSRKILIKR